MDEQRRCPLCGTPVQPLDGDRRARRFVPVHPVTDEMVERAYAGFFLHTRGGLRARLRLALGSALNGVSQ